MSSILVTGGFGFIGSHVIVELLKNNYKVVVIDNFSNSQKSIIQNITEIDEKYLTLLSFYNYDMLNYTSLKEIFENNKINLVIHLAGLKAVGDSIIQPLLYYNNNINILLNLLHVMEEYNCYNLVFSSSATVYGNNNKCPVNEKCQLSTINPYGRTKLMQEQILEDLFISNKKWNIICLRYFNPIGAHSSGLIGEVPNEKSKNLMPYIIKVLNEEQKYLEIFGKNYPTKDGTCIRDYIHIMDLSRAHYKAMEKIFQNNKKNLYYYKCYNIGTGKGYTVLDVVNMINKFSKKPIKYKFVDKRKGDVGILYSDPTLAHKELGWKAKYDLDRMCMDVLLFSNHAK